jgi:hypothetical protein
LTSDELAHSRRVDFTRHFADSWEGIDHSVLVGEAITEHSLDHCAQRRVGAIPPEFIGRIAPTRTEGI